MQLKFGSTGVKRRTTPFRSKSDFGPEDASEPPADSAAAALSPAALERLAFSLCRRGALPDVVQERHGWRGQPDVPDCVEACAREVLTHLRVPYETCALALAACTNARNFFHGFCKIIKITIGVSYNNTK